MYGKVEDAVLSARKRRINSSLECFPLDCATDISKKIISFLRDLTQEDGNQEKVVAFFSKRQLDWTLEIINYSLKQPPDYETFLTCVHCYVGWLLVLTSNTNSKIPSPIREEPQYYARIFLANLSHVAQNILDPDREILCQHVLRQIEELCKEVQEGWCIAPCMNGVPQVRSEQKCRSFSATDSANADKDVPLCDNRSSDSSIAANGVVENAIESSKQPHLDSETWDSVFLLLLELLSKGLQCGRINTVDVKLASLLENFFKIWTLSCSKQYPDSSYWKSLQRVFQENSSQYIVLSAWSSIFLALNKRLFFLIKKHDLDEDSRRNSNSLAMDIWEHDLTIFCPRQLLHTWYRFLNLPVNPSMLISMFDKMDHFSSQLSKSTDVQFKFFSTLGLKITNTVTSAVYTFMNLAANSVVRNQLLIAGGVWEVNPHVANSSPSISAAQTNASHHNSVVGIARRSNRTQGGPFKSFKDSNIRGDALINMDLNSYPLFICDTGQFYQISVESILNTFGEFLFEVCLAGPGTIYELVFAQAEALTCLLRLLSWNRDEKQPLSMQYYSTFCCCLYKALNLQFETSCDVAAYVILSSCNLFISGTKYCSILVPKYLDRILKYVEDSDSRTSARLVGGNSSGGLSTRCHVPVKIFWKSCYHILLTLFPYLVEFHAIHRLSLHTYLERIHNFCFQSVKQEKDVSSISILISITFSLINASPSASIAYNSSTGGSTQVIMSSSSVETFEGATPQEPNVNVANGTISSGTLTTGEKVMSSFWDSCNYKLIYLLINRTVDEWSEDTQGVVVVTALAALRSLALTTQNTDECRTLVVMKLCELIERLLQKPSRHHKTALHSLVVSSYATIGIWLEGNTGSVFKDSKFADAVFEAIEYGLSGSKSISNDAYVYKETKALKVPSLRSRDAAEFLLNAIIDQSCLHNSLSRGLISTYSKNSPTEKALTYFYTVQKERFINLEEKYDSEYRLQKEFATKAEAAALSVKVFSPFSTSKYHVIDKQLSVFDKGSDATMIPPAIPMFELPVTAAYVPGQIPFLPEPLRFSSNCAPERKLLSLAQEVCCDNTFGSIVDESCEDESVFNFTNKFKNPLMCNEPTSISTSRIQSRKFISRFPLLGIDSEAELRNPGNITEPPHRTNVAEVSQGDINSSTDLLEKLSLKTSQVVNVLYIPPFEHFDKNLSVDEFLGMQVTSSDQSWKVRDLLSTLGNRQSQLIPLGDRKNGESVEDGCPSQMVFQSSFCNIFYRCYFAPNGSSPLDHCGGDQGLSNAENLRIGTDACFSSSGQSLQHQQHVHIFLFILNSSTEWQQIQDVAWLSTLADKLKCSPSKMSEVETTDGGAGGESSSSSSNKSSAIENFYFVAYSLFVHENNLITVYIANNLKSNVTFHPLVNKCIVQSIHFGSMLSSSINNLLFDWTIEHVKPYMKRREMIQKMNVKFRDQLLNHQSLWKISQVQVSRRLPPHGNLERGGAEAAEESRPGGGREQTGHARGRSSSSSNSSNSEV